MIALCSSALLSFSFLFRSYPTKGIRNGRFFFPTLFPFFLYLFLKCTFEDSDEAGGVEGGAPLSLILTIVSICQCDGGHTRCVFLCAGQFLLYLTLILEFFFSFFSIVRARVDAIVSALNNFEFYTNMLELQLKNKIKSKNFTQSILKLHNYKKI